MWPLGPPTLKLPKRCSRYTPLTLSYLISEGNERSYAVADMLNWYYNELYTTTENV